MLSRRCQNSWKSENIVVNSIFFFLFVRNITHYYNRQTFIILVLFTAPFYHFLFVRYLDLAERHFSSDILASFPDLSDQYRCGNTNINEFSYKLMYITIFREHQQEFHQAKGILASKGKGRGLSELVKGNFMTKIFFR